MKSRRSMSSAGAWTFQFWLLVLCSLTCAAADAETLYGGFRNPPRSDSLMPYWFWNGDITSAESRRQMREMMAQGVHQAVVFPWGGMKPDSLSEEYWRQVGATLRDVVFAREQTVPSPPQAQTKRLTVAIPPSAVSLEMPAFRKPFRLAIDGKTVSATPKAKDDS